MSAWTTTSIASRFLVDLLAEAGRPVEDVLALAGLTRADLLAPDVAMPLASFRELWVRAAALQPDIGLILVERFPEGQMHMLAHLALRCADVGSALGDVCRHALLNSSADQLAVTHRDDVARVSYRCLATGIPNPWFAEHYLTMAVVFMRRATGQSLPVRRVEFVAAAQAPLAAYVSRFGVEPVFGADENALEFDRTALAWPLLTHDAYLHAILERMAQSRAAASAQAGKSASSNYNSVEDSARRAIAQSLLQGKTPTIEQIAHAIRLGPRALRDRLAQVPSTFRQLLDEARRDLARDHLARGLSVNESAYLLGFSEPAAFQHACKRWFGQSAGELRRDLLLRQHDQRPRS